MSQALLIPGLGRLNLQRLLFGANEVGGIWDWSDRSTMFQDVAGTQPITASGQTRALHLDKSRGLVPGPELVTNGTFDTDLTGWTFAAGTVSWSSGSASYTRGVFGDRLSQQINGMVTGRWYRIEFDVSNLNGTMRAGTQATVATPSDLTTTTNGKKKIIFNATTDNRFLVFDTTANGAGFTIDNISVRELPGNHRYQPNLSNRPQYIEDETGHYGLYDGVDDWDETNAVDFTGTDKMTVWWGGRKLSDATIGTAIELSNNSATNNGSFGLFSPHSAAGNNFSFGSRGTTVRFAIGAGFASPISVVATGIGDISGDIARLRINGVQANQNGADQGTGNYANAKLFFGRRAGTSFPANIREYMTIIRGAQTPTNIIERVEREVRRKIKGLTW